MRLTCLYGILTTLLVTIRAQDVSQADLDIVRDHISKIQTAVTRLDSAVLGYSIGTEATLLNASQTIIDSIAESINSIQPIKGEISPSQAAGELFNTTGDLDACVKKAVDDTIAIKAGLIGACLGPDVLGQLQQQLNSSEKLVKVVASKFAASNHGYVRLSTHLQRAIDAYTDQAYYEVYCSPSGEGPSVSTLVYTTSTPLPSGWEVESSLPTSTTPPSSAAIVLGSILTTNEGSESAITSILQILTSHMPSYSSTQSIAYTELTASSSGPKATQPSQSIAHGNSDISGTATSMLSNAGSGQGSGIVTASSGSTASGSHLHLSNSGPASGSADAGSASSTSSSQLSLSPASPSGSGSAAGANTATSAGPVRYTGGASRATIGHIMIAGFGIAMAHSVWP